MVVFGDPASDNASDKAYSSADLDPLTLSEGEGPKLTSANSPSSWSNMTDPSCSSESIPFTVPRARLTQPFTLCNLPNLSVPGEGLILPFSLDPNKSPFCLLDYSMLNPTHWLSESYFTITFDP